MLLRAGRTIQQLGGVREVAKLILWRLFASSPPATLRFVIGLHSLIMSGLVGILLVVQLQNVLRGDFTLARRAQHAALQVEAKVNKGKANAATVNFSALHSGKARTANHSSASGRSSRSESNFRAWPGACENVADFLHYRLVPHRSFHTSVSTDDSNRGKVHSDRHIKPDVEA